MSSPTTQSTPESASKGSTETPWWVGAVGYEIYPRSFADSTGDGIGDLAGIADRLDHLAWLGVDLVWIAPFYASPGHDHGYDVSDYTDINPIHGTIADFELLSERARSLGLRVIVDLVPNHSSSAHPWFVDAIQSPNAEFRECYVWRDPAPDGGPPNNWVSHFGGPAWTLDEVSGQYYCHLFLPEQPDLNWESEIVRSGFDDTLRFWCERGVDGFRIDVAHALVKDPEFRDNPLLQELTTTDPLVVFDSYDHRHDLHQPGTLDVYRRWRQVVAPYGAMLLGEVGSASPEQLASYVKDGDALDAAFYLEPVWSDWDPAWLIRDSREVHRRAPQSISWVINNHDRSRSVTRFGDGEQGQARSLAVTTFQMCLGGVPFLYQGEELGLRDGTIDPADLSDPIAVRNEGATGRDGCRTAMPWDDSPANGFTGADRAWLHAAQRPTEETVEGQRSDPTAIVHRYRQLLDVRRSLPDLWSADVEWLDDLVPDHTEGQTAVFLRGSTFIIANLSAEPVSITPPAGRWLRTYSSGELLPAGGEPAADETVTVGAETTTVFTRS